MNGRRPAPVMPMETLLAFWLSCISAGCRPPVAFNVGGHKVHTSIIHACTMWSVVQQRSIPYDCVDSHVEVWSNRSRTRPIQQKLSLPDGPRIRLVRIFEGLKLVDCSLSKC